MSVGVQLLRITGVLECRCSAVTSYRSVRVSSYLREVTPRAPRSSSEKKFSGFKLGGLALIYK